MPEISKQIQSLIEQSGKTKYQIAKDAAIRDSTLQRVIKKDWGNQLQTAQKVLNAIGYELKIDKK